jgi:hypothetical protein
VLVFGFHPFGDDIEPDASAQCHDALGERGIVRVIGDFRDKGPVDFQAIKRQLAQMGERRISGTEIVDGYGNASAAQLFQSGCHFFYALEQGAFGYFDLQATGVDRRLGDDTVDHLQQSVARQLHGGQVD